MFNYAIAREQMVVQQIEGRGIRETAVLQAMRNVPREAFVQSAYREHAYDDTPLPIPNEQTISQPYVVALMLATLQPQPEYRVLEIGTGSGYAAALLGQIVQDVHTVERHSGLVDLARSRLMKLAYTNVHVHHGDGSQGWPEFAPYDGIVVAASGPHIPQPLKEQMAIGARLVMPVGEKRGKQQLICLIRHNRYDYELKKLGGVAFVPLVGENGW